MDRWIIYKNHIKEGQATSWHKALANIMKTNNLTNVRIFRMASGYYEMSTNYWKNGAYEAWSIKLERIG